MNDKMQYAIIEYYSSSMVVVLQNFEGDFLVVREIVVGDWRVVEFTESLFRRHGVVVVSIAFEIRVYSVHEG